MPLTPNGKIDRQALAALAAAQEVQRDDTAPRTPVEEVLAGIWADVFERGRVDVHDRFADLGGHSLLAIQIMARVAEAFQTHVPLRAIFEAPTVAGLAERVEEAMREGDGLQAPPITPAPRDGDLPLSFSQERLWFLAQLEPDSAAYNVPLGMRLVGHLDAQALEQALGELARRHEVLRTTFTAVLGKPVQVVHDAIDLPLPLTDLGALADDTREAVARREAEAEARRPFDLARGPLVRARLLRLAPESHVLLLTLHHIVSDAWTRGILNRELAALYGAIHAGLPHALPALPIQYADYASWQRRWLTGAAEERLLGYWKDQLRGAPAAIELPTDRPRPPVLSGHGAHRALDLPAPLARALEALARREDVTLFMLLLAAFDVLLHRYTGQEDLVVGTPSANRTRAETEGLLGFFVNTLVLRVKVSPERGFRDLLATARETCLGAYAHQEMPFERLVTELAPARDLARTPLFQVMFTLQSEPVAALRLPGIELSSFGAGASSSKFDLLLAMTQGPRGIRALVEHATDLFDGATIDRMLGHLATLLEGIALDPDRPLRDLPLLPEAERHRLLVEWNPAVAHPARVTLHGWFEAQVDRTPDAPAVTFEGQTLAYRELDARANRVAHHLRKRGVGPGVLVGLATERSMDMLVGLVGILKAGGAYLPIDPAYPADRIAFMVEDARAPVVLTEARVASTLPASTAEIVILDAGAEAFAAEPAHRPACAATPGDLAYVIYTSGSTGKPKGAMVEHRNVVRLFEATDAWFRFGPGDVWTLFHSHAFDFSVWEIWGALLHGGRVVIVPHWVSRSPEAFHALLVAEGVTVLNQTPSAFRQLVLADEAASSHARAALALRYVIFGGEALSLGDLRPWWERHGDRSLELVNMYGITETTVHVTYRPVGVLDLERPWSSVVGRQIPDLQVHVLDRAQQLVPTGVPGELYVGGAGVARGYLNRPELTAQRFLPDPFGADPGRRLYRTGDLGRRLASGELEYLGRADDQVKIRGFRIELGEIEAVLGAHPAVREAVVLAREDAPGDRRLVAYLVCREGSAPTVPELRAFAKEKLYDAMVPAAFVLLDALPLTASGKVDRRALPAPDEVRRADLGGSFTAPATPAEEALARIWAAVLRIPQASVHDNFFALGGDSILAIQIVARAREAGLRITPRQIFQHQTIAELAAAGSIDLAAAEQGAVTGPVPLTPIQRWFLEQDVADPHHHNQALFLEVRERLDAGPLSRALGHLIEHHDMLRVRVRREEGGVLHQVIAPPGGEPPLTMIDVSRLEEPARAAAIEAAAAEAQASLDLARGPVRAGPAPPHDPPPGRRRGLVAHPAGGSVDRVRPGASVRPPPPRAQDDLLQALGGDALGARPRGCDPRRGALLARARAVGRRAPPGRPRGRRRPRRLGARGGDRALARGDDAAPPRRPRGVQDAHQRRPAHRARGGAGAVGGLASRARRARRARPRGGAVRGHRSHAHGGLVHDDLPRGARDPRGRGPRRRPPGRQGAAPRRPGPGARPRPAALRAGGGGRRGAARADAARGGELQLPRSDRSGAPGDVALHLGARVGRARREPAGEAGARARGARERSRRGAAGPLRLRRGAPRARDPRGPGRPLPRGPARARRPLPLAGRGRLHALRLPEGGPLAGRHRRSARPARRVGPLVRPGATS
jgi:amino acid adenylation domain-containing protein